MSRKVWFVASFVLLVTVLSVVIVNAQGPRPGTRAPTTALGTGFTYQGQLKQSGALVNATCDAKFGLWDSSSGGAQVSGTSTQTLSIAVSNGLFTTSLDFGATAFNGDARYLAIAVACPSGGSYTNLDPREAVSPAPYALTSLYTAYKNVLVVTTTGGQYNSITAALNSIGTSASATNRYLIYVAPGTYTETVTMKQYVDIEGAGELTTKITQVGGTSVSTGTVIGANNAELRFLTVENTGGNSDAIAIYNGSASPRLTHITATASGASATNLGVYNNSSSSPTMTNVTATASGGSYNYGVYNASSSPTMTNVAATASGGSSINFGVFNQSSSSPTMTNVTATGSGTGTINYGVFNQSSSSPTMTNVTATASGTGSYNYGVYNDSSSPRMTNVTASASGGDLNFGVDNYSSSSPTMTNVTASASGGIYGSYGVLNDTSSSPTMMNVTASASGGDSNYGVFNNSASPTIQNSVMSGSGGTVNYGIYNVAPSGIYTVTVNNSQIKGSTNTIFNDNSSNNYTTRVGASLLSGGIVTGTGTLTCVGVYDENYASAGYTTCP